MMSEVKVDELELIEDLFYALVGYDSEDEECWHCYAPRKLGMYRTPIHELDHKSDCVWWRAYQYLKAHHKID